MDKTRKRVRVENLTSSKGNKVANQLVIETSEGTYFQSYNSMIAFMPCSRNEKVQLDREKWNYSTMTGKYRNQFLLETKKETEKKIKAGEYELVDLN